MKYILAMLLLLSTQVMAQKAPPPTVGPSAVTVTVNLTGTPTTGTCGYSMNLNWTAENGSTCTKSGAWSGNVAASGSEVVTVNNATNTYTLQCSASTDSRTLTWTNPTQNVDGTTASLSGTKVYHANTTAGVESATAIVVTPLKTSYLVAGLPAGVRYFGVKATSTAGIDSVMSGIVSTTITLPVGSDSVQATCTPPPQPKPPTGVTVANAVWEINETGRVDRVGRDVGTIPLDVTCLGQKAYIKQGNTEYWGVPRDAVTFYRNPKSTMVLGQCVTKTDG